jgi:hypothetical protein
MAMVLQPDLSGRFLSSGLIRRPNHMLRQICSAPRVQCNKPRRLETIPMYRIPPTSPHRRPNGRPQGLY